MVRVTQPLIDARMRSWSCADLAGSGCPEFISSYRSNRCTSLLRVPVPGKLSDTTLPEIIFPFFSMLLSSNYFSVPACGTWSHRWGIYNTSTVEDGFPRGTNPIRVSQTVRRPRTLLHLRSELCTTPLLPWRRDPVLSLVPSYKTADNISGSVCRTSSCL